MHTHEITTTWRDEPLVPDAYDDIAALVALGRRVRGRLVDFDWLFTRKDLTFVRRAVFEWGSNVTGRYRCFDALVLDAINGAWGDNNSVFYLTARNKGGLDAKVECVEENGLFRLRGHAPFDIVFGYGGVVGSPQWRELLGPTALATLVAAVRALGWDVERLQEDRYRPFLNVLYGMAPGTGVTPDRIQPSGPPLEVSVGFEGPFSLLEDDDRACLFNGDIASRTGVYLWTIRVAEEEWPWYVGQTRRSFGQRTAEHIAGYLSGQYPVFDPAALARGENRLAEGVSNGPWPETLPQFVSALPALVPRLTGMLGLVSIFVALLEADGHTHNRVEGVLGRFFKSHEDKRIGDFFFPGMRVPAAIPGDRPLRLMLTSASPIKGLPSEIQA